VALAVFLAVGSGLFVSSFVRLLNQDMGIDYTRVLRVSYTPRVPAGGDASSLSEARGLINMHVAERLAALPGVEGVAMLGHTTFLTGARVRYTVTIDGEDAARKDPRLIDVHRASSSYLDVVKLPLLKGRWLTDADRDRGEPVVVVNEAAVREYFRGRDPLTVRLSYGPKTLRRVVGVVGDVRNRGPEDEIRPEVYEPMSQRGAAQADVLIRTKGEPATMAAAIKAAIIEAAPMKSIEESFTLSSRFDELVATRRFLMLILTLFGIAGVAIAAIGLYGTLAYTVAQRTKEIGVRMALGATTGTVMRSVLMRAGGYVGVGLVAGLAVAWIASASVANLLFRVEPRYATAAGTLIVAGLLAAWLPARRAARVDPIVALRVD
jgi:putative ABC transport system permease protein